MPPEKPQKSDDYDPSKIKYLEPREHVRLRPGMYIGGVDKRALHHMVWIALDDAMSEFGETVYNTITVSLLANNTICVADDGAGLSLENDLSGNALIESYMTSVGVSGRAWLKNKQNRPSIGLIGVGIPAINALSAFCQLEFKHGGYLWRQTYSEGLATSPLEQIRPLETGESAGTSITFRPDFTIMEENDFEIEHIMKHCQELAYLLPQLRFTILDKRETKGEINYHYPKGLAEWVITKAGNEAAITEVLTICYECELLDKEENRYIITIQLALQWLKTDKQLLYTFVNTVPTPEGGTQIKALEDALKKQFRSISRKKLQSGLFGIIHILHPYPQFERFIRLGLINTDIFPAMDKTIKALFAANPDVKAAIQARFKR